MLFQFRASRLKLKIRLDSQLFEFILIIIWIVTGKLSKSALSSLSSFKLLWWNSQNCIVSQKLSDVFQLRALYECVHWSERNSQKGEERNCVNVSYTNHMIAPENLPTVCVKKMQYPWDKMVLLPLIFHP